jgi:hypothetical protein
VIAAGDRRLVDDDTGFSLITRNLRDVESGIDGAEIRLRRFAIDGSVLLVASSYDDGVAAIALTKEQARAIGLWFDGTDPLMRERNNT